jgi:hypothetical protein
MIFRQFNVGIDGRHAYIVACEDTRRAAVIDPHEAVVDQLIQTLEDLDLQLTHTFETSHAPALRAGALMLRAGLGARRVAPRIVDGTAEGPGDLEAKPEDGARVGGLFVAFVEPPSSAAGAIAYRIADYLFSGLAVVIDLKCPPHASTQGAAEIIECVREGLGLRAVDPDAGKVRRFRQNPRPVPLASLVTGSLRDALEGDALTPKESRVAHAYLEQVDSLAGRFPTAEEVAERLGDIDRTGVHVLVHNIRWKQIEARQLPLVLKGQMSKWLRGIQTEPEWTSHEREFLTAYLELVAQGTRPPTGPEIVKALGDRRNVQWVRKRAHTIRCKQREFNQPLLLLSREPSQPKQASAAAPGVEAPR